MRARGIEGHDQNRIGERGADRADRDAPRYQDEQDPETERDERRRGKDRHEDPEARGDAAAAFESNPGREDVTQDGRQSARDLSVRVGREKGRRGSLGGVEEEDRNAPLRAEDPERVGRADVSAALSPQVDAAKPPGPETPWNRAEQESCDKEQRVERNLETLPGAPRRVSGSASTPRSRACPGSRTGGAFRFPGNLHNFGHDIEDCSRRGRMRAVGCRSGRRSRT